jgi:hypothetical protein
MVRRSEIVSPKYVLRDMVLKRGGAMGLTQILGSREFRGRDANEIRQLVYQLRKENKGGDFGYGVEAWELLDRVVFGLESCLTQRMRWKIQKRRHAKERGTAEQTVLDNVMFRKKIEQDGVVHREEIIRGLEASCAALQQAAKSSTAVRDTLVEHKEEFGNEE